MANFAIFKIAAVFDFKNSNFLLLILFTASVFVILPNFVPVGQTFAEIWQFFYFLDGGHQTPTKLPLPFGDMHGSLGPPDPAIQNSFLISSAIFAGFTNVTNRQTDHATLSLEIGR